MQSSKLVICATAMLAMGAWSQGPAGWGFHREIKINTSAAGANVAGKVDKFPLPVILKGANFPAEALANGADIRFTKPDGSPLPHEIEHWDKAGQSAAVWVKVDVLGNSASQAITMHWGKADAPSTSDGKAVFAKADGWLGVWHLSETGSTTENAYKDASETEAHGTGKGAVGPASTVDGRVGKAHKNVRTGKDWIRIRSDKTTVFNPTTPDWTVSVWTNVTTWPAGSYQNVMSKGDVSWTLQRSTARKAFQHCTAATPYHVCAITNADLNPGTWILLTAVWVKNSYLEMYADGKADDKTTWVGGGTNWSNWRVGTDDVGLANQARGTGEADRYWDGILDEARVRSGTSSVDFIKLDYEAQKEGSKLLEFGPSTPSFVRRTLPGYLPVKGADALAVYDLQGRLLGPLARPGVFRVARAFGEQ